MKRRMFAWAVACALILPGVSSAASKEEEQAEVRKAAQQALDAVYKAQPAARKAVEAAAGYAAFSNFGMKILVAGSGTGKGMAVNNKTKAETYMKMAESAGRPRLRGEEVPDGLGLRDRESAQRVHQLGLGVRRAGHRVGEGRRQGRGLPGRRGRRARRLGLPDERRQPRRWSSRPRAPSTTKTATSTDRRRQGGVDPRFRECPDCAFARSRCVPPPPVAGTAGWGAGPGPESCLASSGVGVQRRACHRRWSSMKVWMK